MNKWKIGEIRDLSTSDSYQDGQQYYLARELSGLRKKKKSPMGGKKMVYKVKEYLVDSYHRSLSAVCGRSAACEAFC